MIDKNLISAAADKIKKRATALEQFDCTKLIPLHIEIPFADIQNGKVESLSEYAKHNSINNYEKNPSVYVISINESHYNYIIGLFSNLYRNKGISFSHQNKNYTSKSVLYVGKTMKNIETRLKHHLTENSKSTYSLHMQCWNWMNPPSGKVYIDISFFPVGTEEPLVQDIEDALWDREKPMFGKQGKK